MRHLVIPAWVNVTDYLGDWAVYDADALIALAASIDFSRHDAPKPKPIAARLALDASADQFEDAALSLSAWAREDGEYAATEMVAAPGGKSIALVKLTGLLMKGSSSMGGTSTVQARREIRAAAADPGVAGILLAIESPGGTVAGTAELARDIKAAGKAKPLWSYIEDLGASAAYWAASQSARVVANDATAQVGSIGTYQVIRDTSAAAEKNGTRTLVFATGPLKGLGAEGSKVTEEQAAHVQALVEASQQSFDDAVKTGRGMTQKQLSDVRHGGVMLAPAALDAKLIDAIQPLGKVLSQFAESLKNPARAEVQTELRAASPFPMIPRRVLPMLPENQR